MIPWLLAVAFAFPLLLAAAPVPGTAIDPDALGLEQESAKELRARLVEGDWRRSEALLSGWSRSEPDNANVLEALGEAHFRTGRYLPAAQAFERADRMRPISALHRFALATAYIAMGRRHWARPQLERLAEEDPENAAYPYWMAGIYLHYQWFEKAAVAARSALSLDPSHAAAQERLGECLEGMGQLDEAEAAYEVAIRQRERRGEPAARSHWLLGSLASDRSDVDTAATHLRLATEIDPRLSVAHFELGLLLRKMGKLSAAAQSLRAAAELEPLNPKRQYALATTLRRAGDPQGAARAMARFRALADGAATP